jgi:ATPase family associated with various cellular activities (AAA)
MAIPTKRPRILILGSVARNTLLVPSKNDPEGFVRQEGWVGAPLVREMICQALIELSDDATRSTEDTESLVDRELQETRKKVRPDLPDAEQQTLYKNCVNITTIFKQVSKTSDPKDRESVLRVATHYTSVPEQSPDLDASLTLQMKASVADCPDPDVLVLFDFDPASRRAARSSLRHLKAAAGRRMTIIGFAGEIRGNALDWLAGLTPGITGGPERTVAVLRAEELRKAGLLVVESGPIERTIRDLFPYFKHPTLQLVAKHARHLVILFEEVGAVCMKLKRSRKGSIHLSSNSDWIALESRARFGRTPGRMSITLAAIVRQLSGVRGRTSLPDLSDGVRLSNVAFSRYFVEGYDSLRPLATLESTLSYRSRAELKTLLEGPKPNKRYFISTLTFPMNQRELSSWTRLNAVFPRGAAQAPQTLRLIVQNGPEAAFRADPQASGGLWFPQARILCPYMQVGDLKTFDEEEIAGFTSLTKLFRKYLQTPGWKAPLSIAVFGPPGTGKSFGVRELMKSINPASEKELAFNLSQLTSVEELNDAFRDVQHRVLSSEEVPLVFFDEFDANFGNAMLGWLKHFLAPMQDGVFRGKASDYRIGRAFFVFAGGTSDTFSEFKGYSRGKQDKVAKAAKLRDFVSRLQGFLDIQSINPPEYAALDSPQKVLQRQIKRALLLRSLLLTHAKPIIQKRGDDEVPKIDDALIDALLGARRYEHGLRSMESVVRMSKWVDGAFIPASLPSRSLLEMHVTGLTIQGADGPATLC